MMEASKTYKTVGYLPSFDNNGGWLDEIYKVPYDEFFVRQLTTPPVNITEDDKAYTIAIAAPGLLKEDFRIELTNNLLTITVQKEKEENEKIVNYNKHEYNYADWTRSFKLSNDIDIDKIFAEYPNGELRITIVNNGGIKNNNSKTIAIS